MPKPRHLRGGPGARLPTEAEFQRAAFGVPGGGTCATPGVMHRQAMRMAYSTSRAGTPEPVGSHPGRPKRVGDRRSRRQRMGVDEHAIRTVSRVQGDDFYPEVLR